VRARQYSQVETFPYILGRDFYGVISAVGDAVFGVCAVSI
jgi:NADPH:quinone reductase-like Zn-dependent oxidoreductase